MEDRLRTAETNIEVLKNKTKVSQNRISDLERGYEKLSDKVDVISGNMNKWMGVLLLSVFISPFLFNIWMSS
tara:strand:- start:333 stop:548 length:216 start_codon:yes stop_codon:yes gene_type:complete